MEHSDHLNNVLFISKYLNSFSFFKFNSFKEMFHSVKPKILWVEIIL